MINISEIKQGDVFSELSHYVVDEVLATGVKFLNTKTQETFVFTNEYVEKILLTADQYQDEVEVGKEDKMWTAKQIADAVKSGDLKADHKVEVGDVRVLGIRSLFEGIHSEHVFTVSFMKADTPLSTKKYNEALKAQRENFIEQIEKAKSNKKSMATAADKALTEMQNNPVLPYIPGEERVLRGYKVQFSSRDGKYNCMDMDINEIRPVNINTIQWLVFNGVKYVVR